MRDCVRWVGLELVVFLCLVAPVSSSGVTVDDGEFPDSSWSHEVFVSPPGGGESVSAGHTPDGGNPGAAQAGVHDFGLGALFYGHFHISASYSPGLDGELSSVWFTLDFSTTYGSGNCGDPGDPDVAGGLLVRQAGEYFITPDAYNSPAVSEGWYSFTADDQGPTDFIRVESNGTFNWDAHPDFSESGATLDFGYVTANSTGAATCFRAWAADNFHLELEGGTGLAEEPTSWGVVKALYRP